MSLPRSLEDPEKTGQEIRSEGFHLLGGGVLLERPAWGQGSPETQRPSLTSTDPSFAGGDPGEPAGTEQTWFVSLWKAPCGRIMPLGGLGT